MHVAAVAGSGLGGRLLEEKKRRSQLTIEQARLKLQIMSWRLLVVVGLRVWVVGNVITRSYCTSLARNTYERLSRARVLSRKRRGGMQGVIIMAKKGHYSSSLTPS
jgi:hypothetical protein